MPIDRLPAAAAPPFRTLHNVLGRTMRLNGKIAVVTGGGSGFGEGIAERFAQEGARVAVVDIKMEGAERVAKRIGERAIAIRCDVSARDDVEAAIETTRKHFGMPHIVVNNAGITHKNQPLMDVDEATFDRIFAVNVKSIFHFTQAVAPAMRDNGRRGHPERRLDRRHPSAPGAHLV